MPLARRNPHPGELRSTSAGPDLHQFPRPEPAPAVLAAGALLDASLRRTGLVAAASRGFLRCRKRVGAVFAGAPTDGRERSVAGLAADDGFVSPHLVLTERPRLYRPAFLHHPGDLVVAGSHGGRPLAHVARVRRFGGARPVDPHD